MAVLKRFIGKFFKNDLEKNVYYKEDKNVIRRSLTDKVGRKYCASDMLVSKKE